MKLFVYMLRRIVTNPYVLFWGVAFISFFVVIGAFVISRDLPNLEWVKQIYTAAWFGVSVLLSFGAAAVSTTIMISYQTGGLPHLFRFSRLTPAYFLGSLLLGSVLSTLIIGTYMLILVTLLFSYSLKTWIAPIDIPLTYLTLALAGVFFSSLSLILGGLTARFNRKTSQFVNFIPLILSYLFGYAYLYMDLGKSVYLTPFNAVELLGISAFTGKEAPLSYASLYLYGGSSTAPHFPTVSNSLLILNLCLWSLVLCSASAFLLRRLYLNPVEEGKML
jgi:hypothetical protein